MEVRLVHLIGKLGDDDALPVVSALRSIQGARLTRMIPRPFGERRIVIPWRPLMKPAVGKSGPWMWCMSPSMVISGSWIMAHVPVDHLPEVVGRDVRRHADGDPGVPFKAKSGIFRRQDGSSRDSSWLGTKSTVFFSQIRQEFLGDPGHPDLRVPHGGGRIAVDGPEIPLAVDEEVAPWRIPAPSAP